MMERLQKIIAASGVCSRRKAEELIVNNKVYVNGNLVNSLGSKASYEDEIIVDGIKIKKENKVYFLLNKPKGYITTSSDTHDRLTVIDIFKNENERVFSVGRLDKDTTGMLLITNDGELANKLIHPRYEISKIYIALCKGYLTDETINKLVKGITLEDGPVKAKRVKILGYKNSNTLLEIEICVGKNHIVKRMIEYLGSEVISLHRKQIAFLKDENLKEGSYRSLTKEEVDKLKNL